MAQAGYKIRNPEGIYFLSCAVVQRVDIFTRPQFANLVAESLNFCVEKKGLQVHAWVLMPNHIHLIASAKTGFVLSEIIRDFKKFTAGKILKALEETRIESRKSWMVWLFASAGKANSRNEKDQFW